LTARVLLVYRQLNYYLLPSPLVYDKPRDQYKTHPETSAH